MGPLEIALIVIGILVVAVSFGFSDRIWGKEEPEDIEEYKNQLKQQMDSVFDEHAGHAREEFEAAAREAVEQYVSDAKRSLEVMVNETKVYIDEKVEQSDARMREYIVQAQTESKQTSEDTKARFEEMLAEHQKALKESSEQVIAEINHHHNDVTFLYSMINDKEEEIKKHTQMVDELQIKTATLGQEIKEASQQAQAISKTTKEARKEFVSEIAEGVIQEISSQEVRETTEAADAANVNRESVQETRVFDTDRLNEAAESEDTKTVDKEDIEELLHAIGQSVEKVAQEDSEYAADITDSLFEDMPLAREEKTEEQPPAADKEAAREGSGDAQEQAVAEVSANIEEHTAADDSVERQKQTDEENASEQEPTETARETSELAEKEPVPQEETEANNWQETKAEESEKEALTSPEEIVQQSDDQQSEETAQSSDDDPSEETAQQAPESAVGVMAEDVVSTLMSEIPTKLIRAVENSKTVSNDADMEARIKVLEMYDQGYSSMEIAETMKLGIGEVRMIVDLYSRRER